MCVKRRLMHEYKTMMRIRYILFVNQQQYEQLMMRRNIRTIKRERKRYYEVNGVV